MEHVQEDGKLGGRHTIGDGWVGRQEGAWEGREAEKEGKREAESGDQLLGDDYFYLPVD